MNSDLQKKANSKAFITKSKQISNVLKNEVTLLGYPTKYNAIWDTGATNTVINENLAKQLQLPVIGKQNVSTANGPRIANIYLISLLLPNNVPIDNLPITDGQMAPDVDFLIGMDIINKGSLTVSTFDGKTSFSFIIPSFEETDYCKTIENARKYLPSFKAGNHTYAKGKHF